MCANKTTILIFDVYLCKHDMKIYNSKAFFATFKRIVKDGEYVYLLS